MEVPILSMDGVTKQFGGILAVNDLSFEVNAGEVIGLMGPNGAGKTTLLNVLSGEYQPEDGIIKFKGKDITGRPAHKICHLGIARTYQIPQPFVKLSVLQNVIVAARFGAGLHKDEAEREAVKILDFVGLTDRKDTPAGDLVVLTLKRLELARVLASKPELMMIDEVAGGLTESEIPQLLELLKKVREMGITILLIEHVMKVMMGAVDRIVVIDKGAKIAEGTPNEIMENKTVIEAYFG